MEQHAQQNERIIQGLQDVKNAVANNKPVFGGGSLLDMISQNAATEQKGSVRQMCLFICNDAKFC